MKSLNYFYKYSAAPQLFKFRLQNSYQNCFFN